MNKFIVGKVNLTDWIVAETQPEEVTMSAWDEVDAYRREKEEEEALDKYIDREAALREMMQEAQEMGLYDSPRDYKEWVAYWVAMEEQVESQAPSGRTIATIRLPPESLGVNSPPIPTEDLKKALDGAHTYYFPAAPKPSVITMANKKLKVHISVMGADIANDKYISKQIGALGVDPERFRIHGPKAAIWNYADDQQPGFLTLLEV